jgi:thioesterase domain-containing protein/acyl carrier protein
MQGLLGRCDRESTQPWKVDQVFLGLATIGICDNFFDLGGNSLIAEHLIERIEERFGERLPLAALFQAPAVERLAKILGRKQRSASLSALVPIQPYGSTPPFFCVHGTASYVHLKRHLGANYVCYGLAQHLTERPIRYLTVEDIAAHYLDEVRSVQPKGPYALGGHSFGALVAFEMAQQLQNLGETVSLLALIDPAHVDRSLSLADSSLRSRSAQLAALNLQGKLNYILEKGRERIAYEMQRISCRAHHRLGLSLPSSLQRFYVEKIVFGEIYPKAGNAYVPRSYPGNVIIFHGAENSYDSARGWQALVSGELEIQRVSGDHLSILAEPHVRLWAEALKARLQLG